MKRTFTGDHSGAPTKSGIALLTTFLFVLAVGGCLAFMIRSDIGRPFWMDEVLAVWIARLDTPGMVWNAVYNGGEFSPPAFHFVLRAAFALFGDTRLVARIPSMLAIFVTAACVFKLLWRRVTFASAAVGTTIALSGILLSFAIQARQYALVTACFACAAVLWDIPARSRPEYWRTALLALLLTLATALHFYGVLVAGAFAFMEACRTVRDRKVCLRFCAAIAVGGLSTLIWLPLIDRMHEFCLADAIAPSYYAAPTLSRLGSAYSDIVAGGFAWPLTLLATLLLLSRALRYRLVASLPTPRDAAGGNENIVAVAALLIPLAGYGIAVFVTGTFNLRYVIAGTIGVAILSARLADRAANVRGVNCAALAISATLTWNAALHTPAAARPDGAIMMLGRISDDLPIVITEGLRYFELVEAAPPDLRPRLVYLKRPPGMPSLDPTNDHQVKRWAELRPDLRIVEPDQFLASTPRFHLLHTDGFDDPVMRWLSSAAGSFAGHDREGPAWLFDVISDGSVSPR